MIYRILRNIKSQLSLSKVGKDLLTLALPIIGAHLLHTAYNLTDMIWVGALGSSAVAAVGSAGFFINIGWALASVITVGVNVKISHSIGAKDWKSAGRFAISGLWGISFLSVLFTSILLVWPDAFIGFFEMKDAHVNEMATSYLIIAASGSVLNFTNLFFISIFNAQGKTKTSLKASLVGTSLNILLDPIFIFLLDLGVEGAAYATIIGRSVSLIYFIFAFQRSSTIRLKGYFPHLDKVKSIIKVGFPAAFQRISFSLIYIVMARIIAEWGPTAIAVQKIGVQIEAFTFMIVGGLMQAVTITVGKHYGAKDMHQIPKVFRAAWQMAFVVGVLTTFMFLLIPETLFSIFVPEKESILMGKNYLQILAISQLFMCMEMIAAAVFHGVGKTSVPAIVSVVFTSMRIPLAYVLGFCTFLSLNGVWWSISLTSIIKGVLLFFILKAYFRKYNLRFEKVFVFSKKLSKSYEKL
ncbi:MATE family efflux transporter [Ancylomarina sp.]|uniref:MATE family efflux transporter n=1 Tax=Ancylomarina sp. TaxID=1970196 RepID=UPI00356480EF